MKIRLREAFRRSPEGQQAEAVLRSCVHCGFCNATCPTYLETGHELDGPRGRIWLMKAYLEGEGASKITTRHLDRCLTCRNCETTCPSGVVYHDLLAVTRNRLEDEGAPRPLPARLARWALRTLIPRRGLFWPLYRLGQRLRPLMPARFRESLVAPSALRPWRPAVAAASAPRRVLLLAGCVEGVAIPDTQHATARVLKALGLEATLAPRAGCCGALPLHLGARAQAQALARQNIDAWWPELESGAEALVMTASGCGVEVKAYGALLADDPAYAERAAFVAEKTLDLSEYLQRFDLKAFARKAPLRVAWHPPCTLQHGQGVRGVVEGILDAVGVERVPVAEGHLCCGAAGTNALLEPAMAQALRARKLTHLEKAAPERIVTANIGCELHLAAAAGRPVSHWITLLAEALER